jgi:REP element-mobilizing transposase RayT
MSGESLNNTVKTEGDKSSQDKFDGCLFTVRAAVGVMAVEQGGGHNRSVVFAGEGDYQYYSNNLGTFKKEYKVKVYGFCLMTNHIHLIVDPGDSLTAIPELMKRLSGRQTRYVNKLERLFEKAKWLIAKSYERGSGELNCKIAMMRSSHRVESLSSFKPLMAKPA